MRTHPFSHPSHADFSPDCERLAVKSTSGHIVVLSRRTGELLFDFRNSKDGEGSNLLYSECGQFLVDGSWAGVLRVRREDTGGEEFAIDFPGEMICEVHRCKEKGLWVVRHSPKATTNDKPSPPDYFTIWKWPFRKDHFEHAAFTVPFVRSSALAPNGQYIAVAHGVSPDMLTIFHLETGSCVASVPVRPGDETGGALTWSPDGRCIASVQNGVVRLYDFPELTLAHEITLEYPCDVSFSHDGSCLAIGSWTTGWLLSMRDMNENPRLSLEKVSD